MSDRQKEKPGGGAGSCEEMSAGNVQPQPDITIDEDGVQEPALNLDAAYYLNRLPFSELYGPEGVKHPDYLRAKLAAWEHLGISPERLKHLGIDVEAIRLVSQIDTTGDFDRSDST